MVSTDKFTGNYSDMLKWMFKWIQKKKLEIESSTSQRYVVNEEFYIFWRLCNCNINAKTEICAGGAKGSF